MKTGVVIAIVAGVTVVLGVAGIFVFRKIQAKKDEKDAGLLVGDTAGDTGTTASDGLIAGADLKKHVAKKTVKQWIEEKYGKGNWRPQWKKMKKACKNESSPKRKWRLHLAEYLKNHVPADVNPFMVPDTLEV